MYVRVGIAVLDDVGIGPYRVMNRIIAEMSNPKTAAGAWEQYSTRHSRDWSQRLPPAWIRGWSSKTSGGHPSIGPVMTGKRRFASCGPCSRPCATTPRTLCAKTPSAKS